MPRRTIATFIAATAICLFPLGASAEETASSTSGGFADLTFSSHTFQGEGHRGPYFLPHERLLAQSETVVVDWVPLTRGTDYTIHADTGVIYFVKPLGVQEQATVRYAHTRATPKRKVKPVSDSTEVYKSETSDLKVVTGLAPNPKSRESALGNYGVDATTSWFPKLRVSSTFLVSDRLEQPTGTGLFQDRTRAEGGSERAADNTAMHTAATYDAGRAQFSATLTQVGENYQGVGKDKKRFAPGTRSVAVKATHAVSDAVALRAAHTTAEREKAGRSVSETETTSGGVNVKLGAGSDLDLSTNRTQRRGAPETTRHALKSHVAASDRVDLGVTATRTEVDGGQRTEDQRVTSQVRPSDHVALNVAAGRTKVDGKTTARTREVKSQLNPQGRVNLTATYKESELVAKDLDTRKVALQARAGRALTLKGTFTQTEAPETDPVRAHQADVELRPHAALKLNGTVAEERNPTGYRSATGGAVAASVGSWLTVSGAYTERESEGYTDLGDTRELKVSFSPFDKLSLQAKLSERPYKKLWEPKDLAQRSLRVGSRLSPSVNVSGGYSQQEWYGDDRTTDVAEVRLELDFFRRHSLYAGLQLTNSLNERTAEEEALYSLGYAYRLGSSFSLSLDGTVTERRDPTQSSGITDRPEYNVEGKLSAFF